MKSAIRVGSVVLADVAAIGTLYPDWSSVTAGMRDPEPGSNARAPTQS
jgi:hypothetical protein